MEPPAQSLLAADAHRPWPLPRRPWLMRQTWCDVLFAHWRVDPRVLRARIPAPLELDLTDGHAWIGIVAFEIAGARIRGMPRLPGLSRFPEVNVRTYVHAGDRPGVYFFSLDAGSAVAAMAARWGLSLPYHSASMAFRRAPEHVWFASRRNRNHVRARLDVDYASQGPIVHPEPGSLEAFLVERYCLFSCDRHRQLFQLEIHHPPWPLQAARADVRINTLVESLGITVAPRSHPLFHYARRQDVLAWWPTPA